MRRRAAGIFLLGSLLLLMLGYAAAPGWADGSAWYRLSLESGKTPDGYQWSTGVKGRREGLNHICTQVSIVEPPREGVEGVEAEDAADCGSLRRLDDSVSVISSMGVGAGRVTVLAGVYRMAIRKVVVELSSGEDRVLLSMPRRIAGTTRSGVPAFRYATAVFQGQICIRRTTTFAATGGAIASVAQAPCNS